MREVKFLSCDWLTTRLRNVLASQSKQQSVIKFDNILDWSTICHFKNQTIIQTCLQFKRHVHEREEEKK